MCTPVLICPGVFPFYLSITSSTRSSGSTKRQKEKAKKACILTLTHTHCSRVQRQDLKSGLKPTTSLNIRLQCHLHQSVIMVLAHRLQKKYGPSAKEIKNKGRFWLLALAQRRSKHACSTSSGRDCAVPRYTGNHSYKRDYPKASGFIESFTK